MSDKWKLEQSKENWKNKAITRGVEVRAARKEISRLKKERNEWKQKALNNKDVSEQESRPQFTKVDIIFLTISLVLSARLGFRAVARVLKVMGPYLKIDKTPCAQTVSNWLLRFTIVKMRANYEQVNENCLKKFTNGWVWFFDLSIAWGRGKILSVLALDLKHYLNNKRAPKLSDFVCLGVSVAASWTGDKIADFLKKIMDTVGGSPSAVLKDGGTDLKRSIKLLKQGGTALVTIDDLSHKIATFFKHEYEKDPALQLFLSVCGKISKNFKQTMLASLAPPKISVSARFMNLHRLVQWAQQLLQHSKPGIAKKDSMLSKLRMNIDQLPACRAFIKKFLSDAIPMLECQKILKSEGLSKITFEKCLKIVNAATISPSIHNAFTIWGKEHLRAAKELKVLPTGLPISSDALESLFGVGKRLGAGQVKDANRIAARLPAFCGTFTRNDAEKVSKISLAEQKDAFDDQHSLLRQRRRVLSKPGSLETLAQVKKQKNVECIMSFSNFQTTPSCGPSFSTT